MWIIAIGLMFLATAQMGGPHGRFTAGPDIGGPRGPRRSVQGVVCEIVVPAHIYTVKPRYGFQTDVVVKCRYVGLGSLNVHQPVYLLYQPPYPRIAVTVWSCRCGRKRLERGEGRRRGRPAHGPGGRRAPEQVLRTEERIECKAKRRQDDKAEHPHHQEKAHSLPPLVGQGESPALSLSGNPPEGLRNGPQRHSTGSRRPLPLPALKQMPISDKPAHR